MTGEITTSHRLDRRWGLVVAGSVVTALALSGCSAGSADGDGGKDKDDASHSEPSDKSSDGAAIEVADTVVTATEDSTGASTASYAIIVANPSADVAVATQLEIRLLDRAGDTVKDLVADNKVFNTTANLVLPGEKQAVTNTTYTKGEVASIEVEAGGTTWYSGDDERFTAVTASDVTAGKEKITFTAKSEYDDTLTTVATYAVLRDADGKLLGGTAPNDAKPRTYEPGSSDGTIEVSGGLPPKWDADATEVYIDPLVEA